MAVAKGEDYNAYFVEFIGRLKLHLKYVCSGVIALIHQKGNFHN